MTKSFPFNNRFAQLPAQLFSEVQPTAVSQPEWIKFNAALATELGLNADSLNTPEAAGIFSGNTVPANAQPLAMAYAGHQFGHWVPQLGDGRAVLLGDLTDANGQYREVQLKGAGVTPYSRNGDGRAWLGPILREYIVSEAMAALGVPTTRALAAVLTGDHVYRENGAMPGAVITRVANSHVRVGTFQYLIARNDLPAIDALMQHMISTCYPSIGNASNPASALFSAVIDKQAKLVAHWQSVGFIHGVMNTDNMAISGETIDYGPCAFLDEYNPKKVFSSIDQMARYAFNNQPAAAQWNLSNFAQALLPFMDDDKDAALVTAQALLDEFPQRYQDAYNERMLAKIGIDHQQSEQQNEDIAILNELLDLMFEAEADFTLTFSYLTSLLTSSTSAPFDISTYYQPPGTLQTWVDKWLQRLMLQSSSNEQQHALMQQHNPWLIPRNHQIEASIQSAVEGDYEPFNNMVTALQRPYNPSNQFSYLAEPPTALEVVSKTFCGT